jgi:hypothetical protein
MHIGPHLMQQVLNAKFTATFTLFDVLRKLGLRRPRQAGVIHRIVVAFVKRYK